MVMATGKITSIPVIDSEELPINTAVVTESTALYSKYGRVGMIGGYVYSSSGIAGNNAVLATLPEEMRPQTTQTIICGGTYNNNVGMFTCKINTSGELYTSTGGSRFTGSLYFPNITYLTK